MPALPDASYLDAIAAEAARIADVAGRLDPAQPVPTCPGWTVRDLIVHLSAALDWATMLVSTRSSTFVPPPQLAGAQGDWVSRIGALGHEAGEEAAERHLLITGELKSTTDQLIAALQEAGPDAPVWGTYGPPEARYWARWSVFEMSVHRADLQLTEAGTARLVPAFAADGVDYLLGALASPSAVPFFRPDVVELRGTGQRLSFFATDVPDAPVNAWTVTRRPDGPELQRWAGPADVTVRAGASTLLLLLKGRLEVGAAGMAVDGDTALLRHWQDHSKS